MTTLRLVAMLALAFMLGTECAGWAQLPAANPLVVPPLPPSPPAQLPAPVTTAVAPVPIAIPPLPAGYSTPGARTFYCSCSGPGTPTHWMGQVTSASYSSAAQSASGACTSYGAGKPPSYGLAGGIGAANSFGSLPVRRSPEEPLTFLAHQEWRPARDLHLRSARFRARARESDRQIRSVLRKRV